MALEYPAEIVRLAAVTDPVERPSSEDWLRTEAELDVVFPQDVKTVVSALGVGRFGTGVYIRNPVASSEYIRLSRFTLLRYREPVSDLIEGGKIHLYPSLGGLVNIGGMDRQDFLLRPDESGRRLADLIWWNIDKEEVKELHMSLSQFIHDLYLGRIEEDWADDLRTYIWRDGREPFFTPRKNG